MVDVLVRAGVQLNPWATMDSSGRQENHNVVSRTHCGEMDSSLSNQVHVCGWGGDSLDSISEDNCDGRHS